MTMLLDAPPAIVPAAVVAFFAVGTAFGYLLVRQAIAVRPLPASGAAPSRPATDALRRLDALDASASDARDAYAGLRHEVLHYLRARFGVPASMAGAEIERSLTHAGATRSAARTTAQLIERCERVMSGGVRVAPERIREDLAAARACVRVLDRR